MLEQADYQLRKEPGIPAEKLTGLQRSGPRGAAIEARICCEDPAASFMPSSGHIQHIQEASWATGQGIRVDTWIQPGSSVSPYFDSLLAKLMVHSTSRAQSVKLLASALEESRVAGVSTSLAFLLSIVKSPKFIRGVTLTTFLEKELTFHPLGLRVRDGGQQTSVQQLRPRNQKGYGIAKSGLLDDLSAAVSNLLVGNSIDTECLEVTHQGPALYFHSVAIVSVCGAPFDLLVDDTIFRLS